MLGRFVAAAVVSSVVGGLASCATFAIHRERFATTYEEAPRAYFEGLSAAETGSVLASWCSLEDNDGWNLDSQSEEEVVCSRGRSLTRDFQEQVTFSLVDVSQGGTCVNGAPTVDNPANTGGGPTTGGPVSVGISIGGGRAIGSRDDWGPVLSELGGTVPVDEAVCGPPPIPPDPEEDAVEPDVATEAGVR